MEDAECTLCTQTTGYVDRPGMGRFIVDHCKGCPHLCIAWRWMCGAYYTFAFDAHARMWISCGYM